MGYLTNSGSGFLSNAVTTVSNIKSYLVNKTGYLVDSIRVGIGDFGQRVLDDGGTIEASAEAAASYREITKDIYDQASLVLFPSGYKDNLLYSHKPVNGSGDFTYTRGTDTATRVGADGYIKKERANLLEQSNQFDTTWNLSGGSTLNQNAVGIDNIPNTAWTFTKDSTFDGIKQNISLSGINTFSVYAKKIDSSVNELVLRINVAGGNRVAIFDLSDGTKVSMTSHSSAVHYDIQKAGNGWYRCSFVVSGTIANVDIRMDYNQTGTGSMLVQNAQLEQGLVATPYIETTTAPVYEGLTDNLPRIDYTGGTPSILLEPSRTNLITQSEYFEAVWVEDNASVLTNVVVSPEGVLNAASVTNNTANSQHKITHSSINVTSGVDYTFSLFLKYNTARYVRLQFGGSVFGTLNWQNFDVQNGEKGARGSALTDADTSIEDYGNGWYRCSITASAITSGSGGIAQIRVLKEDSTSDVPNFVGTELRSYLFGCVVEEGSYPTSYIPNHSGGSVTRAADVCEGAGTSSTFNDDEGVLYVEASALANDGTSRMIALSDATSSNHIRIYPTTTDNRITIAIKSGNVNQYVYHYDGLSDITDTWKVAVRYKRNDFATFVNGTKVDSSSSGSVATGLDELQFNGGASANPFYGKSNQVIVFNSYLSDANCITLTS